MEFRSPRANLLWDKWRYVWMLSWERQRRLHDHRLYLLDLERVRQFSWDDWRKRFLKFMNHKKSRLTDLFRKMDKDNNGLIPRDIFTNGIINTSKLNGAGWKEAWRGVALTFMFIFRIRHNENGDGSGCRSVR